MGVGIVLGSLGATAGSYRADKVVEPGAALLFPPALAVSTALYTGAVLLVRRAGAKTSGIVAVVLAVGVVAWALGELLGHRTRGVTGGDPYAYAQMAVDLVKNGTVLHRFGTLQLVLHPDVNVYWGPLVHSGYHLPGNEQGDAPTVWPVGAAVPLALGFFLGGEDGLYWVNPMATFAAAGATAALAWTLAVRQRKPFCLVVAVLAGCVILTSDQQLLWGRVPMADTQAEVATALAFVAALWGSRAWVRRPKTARYAVLASGVLLGAAYFVRHTQLLIAPALVMLVFQGLNRDTTSRVGLIAGGALVAAVPDLWYHQQSFGGWWHPESEELKLYSWAALLSTPLELVNEWHGITRGVEFGWLIPFTVLGVWRLGREDRRSLIALLTWLVVLTGGHLPYAALRVRDLIPEFPVLAALAAMGAGWVVAVAARSSPARLRPVAGIMLFLTIDAFVLRFWGEATRPFDPPEHVFGYLTERNRASFDAIAELTAPEGIVVADFIDGAVDLFSGRETVRAGLWTPWERRLFFCRAEARGRPIYILDDGPWVEQMLDELRAAGQVLVPLARFELPVFPGAPPLTDDGRLWRLESPCGGPI